MKRFYVDIMGTSDEVTGSCILCVVKLPNVDDPIKFIVDCGCYQENEYDELNKKFDFLPGNLDFALITHTHMDHVGRLPLLCKKGFNKPIYLTKPASHLLLPALEDAARVERNRAERDTRKVLYDIDDVSSTMKLLVPCCYEKQIKINPYITVTFLSNGHLVGASSIFIEVNDGEGEYINILFTGDYNNKNVFFPVNPIPGWIRKKNLTIIQESTYGDMDSTQIVECFEENMLKTIERGSTVVAPVFSLGRAQELLYKLKMMQEFRKLSLNIPIYLDGKLAIRYTVMYLNGILDLPDEIHNFLPENFSYVEKDQRIKLLTEKDDAKVILTTAGMGSYGPAQSYLPAYINQERALIHFTGYCAEDTLGRRLQETEKGEMVKIGGLSKVKAAEVAYTSEFSAHAKADEMIKFLQTFDKIDFVLVNHGETDVKETFARRIVKEVKPKEIGILDREYLFRIGQYGCIKTIPTKFL